MPHRTPWPSAPLRERRPRRRSPQRETARACAHDARGRPRAAAPRSPRRPRRAQPKIATAARARRASLRLPRRPSRVAAARAAAGRAGRACCGAHAASRRRSVSTGRRACQRARAARRLPLWPRPVREALARGRDGPLPPACAALGGRQRHAARDAALAQRRGVRRLHPRRARRVVDRCGRRREPLHERGGGVQAAQGVARRRARVLAAVRGRGRSAGARLRQKLGVDRQGADGRPGRDDAQGVHHASRRMRCRARARRLGPCAGRAATTASGAAAAVTRARANSGDRGGLAPLPCVRWRSRTTRRARCGLTTSSCSSR